MTRVAFRKTRQQPAARIYSYLGRAAKLFFELRKDCAYVDVSLSLRMVVVAMVTVPVPVPARVRSVRVAMATKRGVKGAE